MAIIIKTYVITNLNPQIKIIHKLGRNDIIT